jgi:hypothetical protein
MNALIIKFLLFFIPIIGFSQLPDAYFLLDESSPDYVIRTQHGEFFSKTNANNFHEYDTFFLYLRSEFERVQKEIEIMKENGTFFSDPEGGSNAPHLWNLTFGIISIKTTTIPEPELKKLNLVDFDWLQKNSWKPNNKNILFKDLYFLYETQKDKYFIYKVYRDQVVY